MPHKFKIGDTVLLTSAIRNVGLRRSMKRASAAAR
jgi:hypothetical protein